MADVIHLEGFVAKDPESRTAGSHTFTSVTVAVSSTALSITTMTLTSPGKSSCRRGAH